jgi:uncharacterized protein involved in outer membrane biogenesis
MAARMPEKAPRRWKLLALVWVLGGVAVIALAVVLLLAVFDWNAARPFVAREASAMSGRSVRIRGDLRVHLLTWTPTATVGGLEIGDPSWAPPGDLADIDKLTVSVRLIPLLAGRVELPLVDIERPRLSLLRDASGRESWQGAGGAGRPLKLPPIQRLVLHDGRLHMVDERRKLVLDGQVQSQETGLGGAAPAGRFLLTGQGTLNREPFDLHIEGGSLLDVRRDQPYAFQAELTAGASRITAQGALPKPFDFGLIDADMTVKGRNFGDLRTLTGLALPRTAPYSLQGRLTRRGLAYAFTGVVGRVGRSDLEGDFRLDDQKGRPTMTADLRSRNLDYEDIGPLIGAPTKAERTPAENAAVARMAAEGRFLPDAPLDLDRVRSMDAVLRYRAETVTAPNHLPLRQVRLDLTLDHGVLSLEPVSFIMPHGELTARARIDARGPVPRSDVDLKVLNIRMEDLFGAERGQAPSLEGPLEARAVLHGVGDSIHKTAATASGTVSLAAPHGEIRQAFAELLGVNVANGLGLMLTGSRQQTELRCAVADFGVKDGLMQARTLVIDTDVVRASGQGDINLGTEALDLTLKGKPKRFRILHLSTPIAVTGRLRSPHFGLTAGQSPMQLAGSVAIGLLTPFGALLPFIDPGLTKDADCVSLVAEAQHAGAPVRPSAATRTPSKR